jgi:hypothetical protein
MMAMLRSIGIEKGKAFAPDERRTAVLTEAALVGEAMAVALLALPRPEPGGGPLRAAG